YLGASLDEELDDAPRHRRGQRAAARVEIQSAELLLERQRPVDALVEDVPGPAVTHGLRPAAPRRVSDSVDGQPPAFVAECDPHAVLGSAGEEDEIVVRFFVQPPAIDLMPRRMPIALALGALAR